MGLSGQNYTSVALASGEEALIGIEWEAWWAPELVWTFYRSLAAARFGTEDWPACSPVTLLITRKC